MAGVVSGCFRFNINGPMSEASTLDDLRGSSRVPGAGTHDEPLKTFAGRLLYLGLRGVFPLTRNLEGVPLGVVSVTFGSRLLLHSAVVTR